MTLALIALLLVVVGVLVWRALTREKREYGRFRRLRSTGARRKVYRRWLLESALLLGGMSGAVLLASWPFVSPALRSAREWAPLGWLSEQVADGTGRLVALAILLLVVVALILPVILLRNSVDEIPTVGDVRALLPRTRGELPYGAALGVNAGVVEELLFRLALPALIFGIVDDGLVAFTAASLLFGVLHIYQGAAGVLVTTALGLVFTAVYVVTGSILWPILLHALIDLRSLVLIPVLLGDAWRPRRSADVSAP